ncbi:MAG: hypothetical protein ABJN42_26950 [Roseibium sp.]|uniref:hypothetical protein n=1 Tax=Roseibium sp. TaxID=1936156 RepID=UPI003297566F
MTKCPHCQADISADAPASNREREITLKIPERHFALFRKTFREMNVKLGMMGQGALANALNPYAEKFDEDWDQLRYFDDGALAMAHIIVTNGHPGAVRLGEPRLHTVAGGVQEERLKVFVDFTLPDGEISELRVAENATVEAADWFKTQFAETIERLTPLS